ncbi:MAG: hypothetical protein AB8B64_20170 [Granulosicoccus sp.]
MKNALLAVFTAAPSLFISAFSDTTFGVGAGSINNGLGFNFGRATNASLMYGSLGGMVASSSRGTSISGHVITQDRSSMTNCGFGLGARGTLTDGKSTETGLTFNLGYQF